MSQFTFLQREWPDVYEAANTAANAVHPQPRTACFYARRALELAVMWAYKNDSALHLPYQDNISALIHEPSFKTVAGDAVFTKARLIIKLGNQAAHSNRAIPQPDAIAAVRELFHVMYWLAHTYGRLSRPESGLTFDPNLLPKNVAVPAQTVDQLQKLQDDLHAKDEKLADLLKDKESLDAELTRLRTEVAAAKAAATAKPDTHDYTEEQTRDFYIDLLLKEVGWPLTQERDREFPVTGMPNNTKEGFVDYVLWGDDGKPLGLVEAKKTRRDPRVGQQQAKLYADCLEKQFGQRPVIFYSNGYTHWVWDDAQYPPRQVQGFYSKSELQLAIQRRATRKPLGEVEINPDIVERFYQTRAIRRVAESFEKDHQRKSLLVMATGAGKTRTVIALADLLICGNWVKNVLFLADRVALVNQAEGAFKRHLPNASPVNLVKERNTDGRIYLSTYPTMMGLIDEMRDGHRRFGPGYFDLIVIDEAHRSVFQKYKAIFDYFDSLLVGLTATPKDEVDRNTYTLFDLEDGVPTDTYDLAEAVRDGFLVPAKSVSVALKFPRQGIIYNDLSEEEKEQWDETEWDDPTGIPTSVNPEAINKWLFNEDTVDKALKHLMTQGQCVAGGDRLGKTIIFAKSQQHAEFIEQRFNINYPHLKGHFARVITFKTEYAQSLIDDFTIKSKDPHMAISVDMLDTGIDVPEVVNLVFFKPVWSKTKFWQMVGRGTRLCKDLFGPGQDKKFFYIFDFCMNLEFFSQEPDVTDGAAGESLAKRLFKARLEVMEQLDKYRLKPGESIAAGGIAELTEDPLSDAEVRRGVGYRLHREVSAMNVDNFVVRPKRQWVERFSKSDAWVNPLAEQDRSDLAHEVAGLPTELDPEDEEAKMFDLLMLNLQLAVLRVEASFDRLKRKVVTIAEALEEKSAIPMVAKQMELIQQIQADDWWQDVTIPMLETVRRRLRDLVKFIDKSSRSIIYTNFEDELGGAKEVELPGLMAGIDYDKFRDKAQRFLRAHQDHITIHKLRMNQPITPSDLAELERMLAESGVGGAVEMARAKEESHGLGLFVRSLVGMDREAAKQALSGFLNNKSLNANQIEFVNLVVNHLTEHGVMTPAQLYEAPFTDVAPKGPDGIFAAAQINDLVDALARIREAAVAG